jgi:NarL family two-component system sensor histidine kinase YdfH
VAQNRGAANLGQQLGNLPPAVPVSGGLNPLWVAAFSLLVLVFGALLWWGLSARLQQRPYWPYFILQGLVLLATTLIVEQIYVTLSLYLALILASLGTLKRPQLVIRVVSAYTLVLIVGIVLSLAAGMAWQELWLQVVSGTSFLSLILFVGGYLAIYNQQIRSKERLQLAHVELQEAHNRLADSIRQVEELTLANERQRMARELHDTLSQGLTGIVMQLDVANGYQERQDWSKGREVMLQSLAAARRTLHEARSAIDDLRVDVAGGRNLRENVQAEVERFTATTGIICEAELSGLSGLPAEWAEPIFRMVREGLNNVARHAEASRVRLRATKSESGWLLELGDNGRGFDSSTAATQTGHYGLLGLQERARLVGGEVTIITAPGKGTVLQLRLPLAAVEGTGKPSDPGDNKQMNPVPVPVPVPVEGQLMTGRA